MTITIKTSGKLTYDNVVEVHDFLTKFVEGQFPEIKEDFTILFLDKGEIHIESKNKEYRLKLTK